MIPHFYRMSIAIFVCLLIFSLIGLFIVLNDASNYCSAFSLIVNILAIILLTTLSIACITLIANNLSIYQQIDLEMISFIN